MKAKAAIKVKGWTQDHLAGRVYCERHTIIGFFARRPVDKNFFQAICDELGLEWGDIADLESESEQPSTDNKDEIIQELSGTTQVLNPPASEIREEKTARTRKAIVVLSAKLTADNQAQLQDKKIEVEAIVAHLRQLVGDVTLTIKDIEDGSIKITLEGSDDGIERLRELFESGELTEVLGIPVEDIQLLPDISTQEDDDKSRLIREIRTQGALGRKLIRAKLSDADLSYGNLSDASLSIADLRRANLNRADLSDADLRGACLIGANLNRADLSGANLNRADLSNANLSGATISGVNLSLADLSDANLGGAILRESILDNAIVTNAFFGEGIGLTEEMKRDLERRGARFGDRPPVLSPR